MTPIFVDTFYLLALVNPDDDAHGRITKISTGLSAPLVTTAWVLTEFGDALSGSAESRAKFAAILDALTGDPTVTIVDATPELFARGIELYRHRSDKSWPLTDCISFVVMKDHGIRNALTGDRHFEQAGFKALMK